MELSTSYRYYLMHLQELGKSPHTIKQYGIDGKGFLDSMTEQGVKGVEDDLLVACLVYRNELLTSTYSNRSKNRKISSLRSFLRYIQLAGWLETNVADWIENIPKESPRIEVLTRTEEQQIRSFYRNLQNELPADQTEKLYWMFERNHAMLQVLLLTGITPQELISLKRGHVDESCLYLLQSKLKFREVEMPTGLSALLHEYIQETEKRIERRMENEDYLWFGSRHSPAQHMNIKAVERIVARALADIGSSKTALHIRYHCMSKVQEGHEAYGYSRKSTFMERMKELNK